MAKSEEFSLSFLDTIACSFGGMILVFVMLALLTTGEGESDESTPPLYDGALAAPEAPRAKGGNARPTSPQLYLVQAVVGSSDEAALKGVECRIVGDPSAMWVAKTQTAGQFLFFAAETSDVELQIGGPGVVVQRVRISPQTKISREMSTEITLPLGTPSDVLRYQSTAWSTGPAKTL